MSFRRHMLGAIALMVAAAPAAADAAVTSPYYRGCPQVTAKLYAKPVNLASSFCRNGSYFERLRVADASWTMGPDGEATGETRTYVMTVRRGKSRLG